jgi:hypothetical protein
MRSTPPSVTCLCFKALSVWHLGEIASCQATMAEGISLAKELIEFDPEKEGLPKEGNVYLKIQDRFFELDLKLRMLAPHELRSPRGFEKATGLSATRPRSLNRSVTRCREDWPERSWQQR